MAETPASPPGGPSVAAEGGRAARRGDDASSAEQERREAAASATGSTAAEGLTTSAQADRELAAYVRGDADLDELIARTVARHAART